MRTRSRRVWILVTLVVAVVGITLSNFVGASGSVTGSGSSMASKLSWSAGAISAIAFLVLCVSALRARRSSRR
jgi:hypothetical protein